MALQIWLPLNGNLNNQGLNTYTISNTGVIDSLGKIGSCYSYSKQYTLISGDIISNLSKFSISCWVYLTNASTYNIFTSENSSGYWQFLLGNNSIKVRDSVSGLSGSRIDKTITAIPSSVWVHVTVVYDEGVVKVYQNGVLKDTLTFHSGATMNTHDKMYIGADGLNNTSTYPGNCKINDFRVYNHCLSDKEVSEISKGLILHYKLSENYQTLNNSFNYPTFNISSSNGGWLHWTPSNNTGKYSQNTNREYIYRDTQTYSHYFEHTSGADYYICYQSPAFEGGYRSAQAIIKMPNGEDPRGHVWFSHNANVGTNPPTTFTQLGDGFWLMKHEGFQQDGSNDLVSIGISHNKGVYVSEAYLENDKKVCSDIFSTNNNNVIDCSGYTREGEIIGNLTTNSDTPRYDYVTSFDGKSYIQITSPSVEVRSVSFWAKWNSIPSGQSVVFVDQKSRMGFGLMSTGILRSSNGISTNTFNKTSIVANKWYHFVIVNTGTAPTSKNRDLFINGVKQIPTSNSSNWTFNIDYLQVGKRSTTSDGFVGSISDFRMYVTPLTDNDVMDLYSTSTSVDNFGNLHCYEVDESTENLFKVEYINEVSKLDINWTLRNGEYALILNPTNFYENGVYTKVLKGKFLSNTQYKFDLWMDSDELIYQNVNRPGGLVVVYTDGTNSAITVTGSSSSPKGFQHMVFYSDINKSVDYVTVYYYVGNNVYYRWDSVIIPIGNETSVNKNGIVKTGQIRENSVVASICKGDTFDTHSIIEK